MPRTEEFAAVAESLNHMAEELDDQIGTLTRERNEREAVLSSMVEGVLAVDLDERIIAVNAAAAGLIDVEPGARRAAPSRRSSATPICSASWRRRCRGTSRWRRTS